MRAKTLRHIDTEIKSQSSHRVSQVKESVRVGQRVGRSESQSAKVRESASQRDRGSMSQRSQRVRELESQRSKRKRDRETEREKQTEK